jgi:DNA modification methylase
MSEIVVAGQNSLFYAIDSEKGQDMEYVDRVICGDSREVGKELPEECVQTIFTSPPYYGLRKYEGEPKIWKNDDECQHEWAESSTAPTKIAQRGSTETEKYPSLVENQKEWGCEQDEFHKGQVAQTKWNNIDAVANGGNAKAGHFCLKCGAWKGMLGLEPSPELYISHLVSIFREYRRVLRQDGTLWVNIADSYWGGKGKSGYELPHEAEERRTKGETLQQPHNVPGYMAMRPADGNHPNIKPKDLIGIPWMLAMALRDDGWWLRSTIIWKKRNCLAGTTRLYAQTQKAEGPMMLKDLARLHPSTVKLWNGSKWTQVLSWIPSGEDKGIEITLRSGEVIKCTKEHLWPTQRGNVCASELKLGDILVYSRLPAPKQPKTPRMLLDERIGWFIGLYLAEGSFGNGGETIQISSHRNVAEYRYDRLKVIANNYDGTCQVYYSEGNKATVNLHGKILHGIIDTYIRGNGAKRKHLDTKCWRRSNVFLESILKGYLNADGYMDEPNNRWRIGFTRNNNLANDLRTLCARLGLQLRLNPCISKCEGKEYPSYRGEIRFKRSEHWSSKADTEIVSIGVAKKMKYWDVSVEDEPHLFALASGVLTHNCMPSSALDRPTTDFEYIFLLAKNGAKPSFWTHRDGYGSRTKPEADYRWKDMLVGDEVDTEPEGDWRTEVYADPDMVTVHRRWKRYNLWKGHAYYYNAEAIKEPNSPTTGRWGNYGGSATASAQAGPHGESSALIKSRSKKDFLEKYYENGRNKRTVWEYMMDEDPYEFWKWLNLKLPKEQLRDLVRDYAESRGTSIVDVPTKGWPGSHFAVFPPALARTIILAGSSDIACPMCGAAWLPRKEKTGEFQRRYGTGNAEGSPYNAQSSMQALWEDKGLQPTCACEGNDGSGASLVADIFSGAGTTCMVAKQKGRHWLGIEAAQKYVEMSVNRIAEAELEVGPDKDQPKLF